MASTGKQNRRTFSSMHSTLLIDLSRLLMVLDSIDFAYSDEVLNDV